MAKYPIPGVVLIFNLSDIAHKPNILVYKLRLTTYLSPFKYLHVRK